MFLNENKYSFTLVETLLGMVIGAIIMAAVYSVFWTGTKLDAKLRYVHKNYLEVLKADFLLSRDIENAVFLDLSGSYPSVEIFYGRTKVIEFFIKTELGIKRVRYQAGRIDQGTRKVTIIGGHTKKIASIRNAKETLPIEFLLRQEMDVADWLDRGMEQTPVEILVSSLMKDSFKCRYAQKADDLNPQTQSQLAYSQEWSQSGLPIVVSCQFSLYDPKHPGIETVFKRDMFLAPQRGI